MGRNGRSFEDKDGPIADGTPCEAAILQLQNSTTQSFRHEKAQRGKHTVIWKTGVITSDKSAGQSPMLVNSGEKAADANTSALDKLPLELMEVIVGFMEVKTALQFAATSKEIRQVVYPLLDDLALSEMSLSWVWSLCSKKDKYIRRSIRSTYNRAINERDGKMEWTMDDCVWICYMRDEFLPFVKTLEGIRDEMNADGVQRCQLTFRSQDAPLHLLPSWYRMMQV